MTAIKTYGMPGGIFLSYTLDFDRELYVVTNEAGDELFASSAEVLAQDYCQQKIRAAGVARTLELIRPGRRVAFRHAVDRYPFALVPAGATGTVRVAEPTLVSVDLDQPDQFPGLGEWDGCAEWYDTTPVGPDAIELGDARAALLRDLAVIA